MNNVHVCHVHVFDSLAEIMAYSTIHVYMYIRVCAYKYKTKTHQKDNETTAKMSCCGWNLIVVSVHVLA